MEVAGKVALVTGASAGIGRAIAGELASAGARVIVHGRDPARTEDAANRLHGIPVTADLGTAAGCRALAERARDAYGRVDVLVCNAGRGWSGPFVTMTDREIDDLVTVDLLAAVHLTRGLLPGMIERRSGYLGFVTSIAGRTGVAGEAVYAASKAGLDAFADSVRLELRGTGVGVGIVVPAAVRTGFLAARGRAYDRALPRPVDPDVVGRAAVRAIERDSAEVWVPRWLRIAPVVRAAAPAMFRRLSARFGEPVRSPAGEGGPDS